MKAVHIRTLASALALAALAALPMTAHADRYADPLAPAASQEAPANALSRAQVREELRTWKSAGMVSMPGEIGDTAAVLAARQTFNELQSEVLTAEYAAAERQLQAFAAQPAS